MTHYRVQPLDLHAHLFGPRPFAEVLIAEERRRKVANRIRACREILADLATTGDTPLDIARHRIDRLIAA